MSPPPKPPFLLLLLLLFSTSTKAVNTTTAVSPTTSPVSSPTPRSTTASPVSAPTPRSATPSPISAPTTPSPSSHSTLDPKQLRALQSLDIPTSRDPCIQPSPHNSTTCDSASPFRHLISLHLSNCSSDVSFSYTALKSLSTLQSLTFTNCPITPIRFPSDLALSLHSFTCIHSLKRLTGVWLSHFVNLTDLTVSNVPVNASGLYVILGKMRKLRSLIITNANVTGYIPKHLHLNLTHVDLSGNKLKGRIPSSIPIMENLEMLNLSSNTLTGEIPTNFGDLISLKNVSLGSNSLSGSIPDSISAIPGLVHVDLSSNQFNGTIPRFLSEMKHLSLGLLAVINMDCQCRHHQLKIHHQEVTVKVIHQIMMIVQRMILATREEAIMVLIRLFLVWLLGYLLSSSSLFSLFFSQKGVVD
ncbi:hypothetical protein MANES_16G042000v8 [Manihot esculenta]|uniref:Uncharacterized protein n=1 Tax=Manihot esculenta TaxID=3983 RepID=A0ACB7G5J7_MANES|nr:hypothetical protein MANES_16G042000v8 [Manihot esculenta]